MFAKLIDQDLSQLFVLNSIEQFVEPASARARLSLPASHGAKVLQFFNEDARIIVDGKLNEIVAGNVNSFVRPSSAERPTSCHLTSAAAPPRSSCR